MKRCPYCAEEIRDEAIKCSYCESDLTGARAGGAVSPVAVTSIAAPPDPVASREAIRYTHTGQRYVLGFTADAYGIWDRQAPAGPVERHPRTDDGWRAAWTRYSALEPSSAAVPAAQPPPGAWEAPAPAQTNGLAIASLVLGILWLWWIGSLLALIFGYMAKNQIDRSTGRQGGRGLAIAGIVLGWIGLGLLVLGVIVALSGDINSGF